MSSALKSTDAMCGSPDAAIAKLIEIAVELEIMASYSRGEARCSDIDLVVYHPVRVLRHSGIAADAG